MLPNILGPILVTAVLDIGTMMMELAALSFLGLGARPAYRRVGQHDERCPQPDDRLAVDHLFPGNLPFSCR